MDLLVRVATITYARLLKHSPKWFITAPHNALNPLFRHDAWSFSMLGISFHKRDAGVSFHVAAWDHGIMVKKEWNHYSEKDTFLFERPGGEKALLSWLKKALTGLSPLEQDKDDVSFVDWLEVMDLMIRTTLIILFVQPQIEQDISDRYAPLNRTLHKPGDRLRVRLHIFGTKEPRLRLHGWAGQREDPYNLEIQSSKDLIHIPRWLQELEARA